MSYPKVLKFINKTEEDQYYLAERDYIENLFFSTDTNENRQDKLHEMRGDLANKDAELNRIKQMLDSLITKNTELEGLVELSNKSATGRVLYIRASLEKNKWNTY